jgi:hypothetical protein
LRRGPIIWLFTKKTFPRKHFLPTQNSELNKNINMAKKWKLMRRVGGRPPLNPPLVCLLSGLSRSRPITQKTRPCNVMK